MFDSVDLAATLVELARLEGADLGDAERIDQIRLLEQIKAAAAAAQARISVAFDASQRLRAAERGLPAAAQGQGIAGQIALARRESPFLGARHLGLAKTLVAEMPHTLAALTRGEITEWRATLMARETAELSREDRIAVDAEVGPDLAELGDRQVAHRAREAGYRLDPHALIRRTARAESERCVTLRPAPEAMSYLTAALPLAQGVEVYATLRRCADSLVGTGASAGRTRNQIMADTLVARVTGRERATGTPVEIHLVMTDRAVLGGDDEPGQLGDEITGHGPVPAWLGRRIVREAERAWIRRLYTTPSGDLVTTDSRRRLFQGKLRRLLVARDRLCRTPWCDAPIKHLDHPVPVTRGGTTTRLNAQGLCERCNYAKDAVDWWVRADPQHAGRHRVLITTPTGHIYRSEPPVPPGTRQVSDVEFYLSTLTLAS